MLLNPVKSYFLSFVWWFDFTCLYRSYPSIYFSFVHCSTCILPTSFYCLMYVLPYSVLWYSACAYFIFWHCQQWRKWRCSINPSIHQSINQSIIAWLFREKYPLKPLDNDTLYVKRAAGRPWDTTLNALLRNLYVTQSVVSTHLLQINVLIRHSCRMKRMRVVQYKYLYLFRFHWHSRHAINVNLMLWNLTMMTLSNGNTFHVTGHLCGEFTGHRWIPRTKASDAELWCFLWPAPE